MFILDILFPSRCVGCGRIGRYFCLACRVRIRPIGLAESVCPVCGRPALDGTTHPRCRGMFRPDGLTAMFAYAGPVRAGIKLLKYRLVTHCVGEFFSLIPPERIAGLPPSDIVIPVPLHSARLKERGFNQATVLAELFAGSLHLPMAAHILLRTRYTAPQAYVKHRRERLSNMRHAFAASGTLNGERVLLVDDVTTTGATLRAAATALKRAGAGRVWCVTLARQVHI